MTIINRNIESGDNRITEGGDNRILDVFPDTRTVLTTILKYNSAGTSDSYDRPTLNYEYPIELYMVVSE